MAKNIKYKVTDLDALKKAYPELVTQEQVTREVVNHKKLYALVKANTGIGRGVEGVTLLGADDAVAATTDAPAQDENDSIDDAVTGNDDDAEEDADEE